MKSFSPVFLYLISPHELLFLILYQGLSWVSRLGPQTVCCSVPSPQEIRKSFWLFRSKMGALTFCLTHRYVKFFVTLHNHTYNLYTFLQWYILTEGHARIWMCISMPSIHLLHFALPFQRFFFYPHSYISFASYFIISLCSLYLRAHLHLSFSLFFLPIYICLSVFIFFSPSMSVYHLLSHLFSSNKCDL